MAHFDRDPDCFHHARSNSIAASAAALPLTVANVNESRLPFLARTPSLPAFQPSPSSNALALARSNPTIVLRLGSYAGLPGGTIPSCSTPNPWLIVSRIASRSVA